MYVRTVKNDLKNVVLGLFKKYHIPRLHLAASGISLCGKERGSEGGRRKEGEGSRRRSVFLSLPSMKVDTVVKVRTVWII